MSDIAVMPFSDYKAACDAVRAKTGKTDAIKSGDLATEIDGISSGGSESGDNKLAAVVDRTVTEITAKDLAGITSIGDYAFYKCSSLTSIEIPIGVKSIGNYAFSDSKAISKVHTPSISAWCEISMATDTSNPLCFAHNLYLNGELVTELVIPDGVTEIKKLAFFSCDGITSVIIGSGVKSLGTWCFSKCNGLTSVTIPDTVTSMGTNVFESCSNLGSVVIGNGIKSIGNYAFRSCGKLASVVIPNTITNIGRSAFNGCTSMQEYDFSKFTSVPTLGHTSAFTGIPLTCVMKIPSALIDEWKAATNWSNYADYMVAV